MRFAGMRMAAALLALAAPVAAQQYVFRAWRQADGLKNLGMRSLATDCHGFVWVATESGIFRFMGSGFEHFGPDQGIAELGIQEIATDRGCNVWAGTTDNLYRFDGQRFVPAAESPLRLRDSHDLAVEDERHVLVVDNGHLVRLEHDAQGKLLTLQRRCQQARRGWRRWEA
jgi:ligand-binding sensor domain-containing protein